MRNQTWNEQGNLIQDIEITRLDGIPTAINHLTQTSDIADSEQEELLLTQELDEAETLSTQRVNDILGLLASNPSPIPMPQIWELLHIFASKLGYTSTNQPPE